MSNMKTTKLKSLINEQEHSPAVDRAYYDILAVIRNKSRKLSDDDSYRLHEMLKSFFERSI